MSHHVPPEHEFSFCPDLAEPRRTTGLLRHALGRSAQGLALRIVEHQRGEGGKLLQPVRQVGAAAGSIHIGSGISLGNRDQERACIFDDRIVTGRGKLGQTLDAGADLLRLIVQPAVGKKYGNHQPWYGSQRKQQENPLP